MQRTKRTNWKEGIHYKRINPYINAGMKYELLVSMVHRGPHGLTKTMEKGTRSDGATYAIDLCPEAFFTHDAFCVDPRWDDGTPISNIQASWEYRKILTRYHYAIRAGIRFYATFVFGGNRIKKENGWIFCWKNRRKK